jgi:carbonic anhydrase
MRFKGMRCLVYSAIVMNIVCSVGFCITPQEALDQLMQGNQRYTKDRLLYPDLSSARRESLKVTQSPFAVVLGCSDSRVPPELIFDQGLGALFVVRLAGNVVTPVVLDSIEYAAKYLGSSLILVMGHENCGAIKAVYEGVTQDIEALAAQITPAIDGCKKRDEGINQCVRANVQYVVKELENYPSIKRLIQQKKVQVIGSYYSLDSGKVEIIP